MPLPRSEERRRAGTATLIVGAALSTAFASPALAYVDPSASSLLLQVILGGIASLGVLLRLFWGRLRRKVRREPPPGGGSGPGTEEPR